MEVKIKPVNKKQAIMGIISLGLIIFAIFFAFKRPNESAIGDNILNKIGMKAWSKGTSGIHYVAIYSLILITIGYVFTVYFLKNIYPSFIKKLPIILFIILISYSTVYSTIDKTIKTFSNGINAIDYNMKTSVCNYKSDSNGDIAMNGKLQLKNYSSKDVRFYIKLVLKKSFMDFGVEEETITAIDPNTNSQQEFTLMSGEEETFNVLFKTAANKNINITHGQMQDVNIIIFTENQEKQFIKN